MYTALTCLTLSEAAIQAAAAILADRRLRGCQGPVLPDACRPSTLDDALAIQGAVARLMGDEIAGWKCGMPGRDKLVAAPLYARAVHPHSHGPCPVWAHDGHVRVEPELAFVIGQDLPARAQPWRTEEVDAAITRTHLALELIDSRYDASAEPGFVDKLADGLVNQGLCIGPEVDGEAARLAHEMPIGVRAGAAGGGQLEEVKSGRHPDPLPRMPLYWLAEFLRQQGLGLRAGQVVITGSYAGTFPLPVGEEVAVRHGQLGQFSVFFTAR